MDMIPEGTVFRDRVLCDIVPGGRKGVDVIPEGTVYCDGVLCDIVPWGNTNKHLLTMASEFIGVIYRSVVRDFLQVQK